MRRRRLLRTCGIGLGVGVAGCVDLGAKPSSRPAPEDFEQCDKLIVRIPTLPDPAREEVETALKEGQYETESELYLPHVIPISKSYLGKTGGDPEEDYRTLSTQDVTQHYRAVVTQNGGTNRLTLEPATPTWGSSDLPVENDTDESLTVEIRIKRLRDSEVVVDESLSVPAGDRTQTESFDQLFSEYRVDVQTDQFSGRDEWRVEELREPAEAIVLTSDEMHVRPAPTLEPVSCAEAWESPSEEV